MIQDSCLNNQPENSEDFSAFDKQSIDSKIQQPDTEIGYETEPAKPKLKLNPYSREWIAKKRGSIF